MNKTSLYELHLREQAKMGPFAGFEMPLDYGSAKKESIIIRESVGKFDVSHMGEFFVSGEEHAEFIDYLIPNTFKDLPIGKAVYSPLLNEKGTIIDDLICYRLEKNRSLICVNASNIQKDWDWIKKQSKAFKVNLSDSSSEYSLIALQGPQSPLILQQIGLHEATNLESYSVMKHPGFGSEEIIIARTGYTGEDGFEIFCKNDDALELWMALAEKDVASCGLVARDILRTEAGYPLYGQELSEDWTPLDCGLKWTIKNKEKFIGREALQTYQQKFKLVKFTLPGGIPRPRQDILNEQDQKIGFVTSGTFSGYLDKSIGLALFNKNVKTAEPSFINIRDKKLKLSIEKSFLDGGKK